MKKCLKIAVLGPTYIDHEIYIKGNISLDGSSEIGLEKKYPGGTGLSYSLALAHLNNKVDMYSVIGNDFMSKIVFDSLCLEKNINAKFQTINDKTDYAILLIDEGNHKVAASHRTISNLFDIAEMTKKDLESVDSIVLTSFKNSIADNILSLVENIQKPFIMWAPHRKNCEEIGLIRSKLHLIDHITLSQEEYKIMSSSVNPLDYGVKSLTITRGREGVTLVTENSVTEFEAHLAVENPVDTNGAGEAFGAGFLTSFLTHKDFERAIHAGQYVAYMHIQNEGPNFPKLKSKDLDKVVSPKLSKSRRLDYNIVR